MKMNETRFVRGKRRRKQIDWSVGRASIGDQIGGATSPDEAAARFLQAVANTNASPGTKAKWRRRLARRWGVRSHRS